MTRRQRLLAQIRSAQLDGLFWSERFHRTFGRVRVEDNIFFSASIAYTLLELRAGMKADHQEMVDEIVAGVRSQYPNYEGRSTPYHYGFYKPEIGAQYPGGTFLSNLRHFALPEDADDTAMVSLTLESVSAERVEAVRKALHTLHNTGRKSVRGLPERYAKLPAYATWLGTGRMPIELEICVMCNVLLTTFRWDCPLSTQDLASLEFIRIALDTRDVLDRPHIVSNTYPEPAVILYHVARLVAAMPHPDAHLNMDVLSERIEEQFGRESELLHRVMLVNARCLIGQQPNPVDWVEGGWELKESLDDFAFFRGPMLSGTNNRLLNAMKFWKLSHLQWRCEAWGKTLLLEQEVRCGLNE